MDTEPIHEKMLSLNLNLMDMEQEKILLNLKSCATPSQVLLALKVQFNNTCSFLDCPVIRSWHHAAVIIEPHVVVIVANGSRGAGGVGTLRSIVLSLPRRPSLPWRRPGSLWPPR